MEVVNAVIRRDDKSRGEEASFKTVVTTSNSSFALSHLCAAHPVELPFPSGLLHDCSCLDAGGETQDNLDGLDVKLSSSSSYTSKTRVRGIQASLPGRSH